MRLLLAAVTMLLLAGVPQPVPTVLRFGHVWDGSRLLDDVAVVVSGDRIVSVTDGQRGLARDAVDLRTLTAIPGLIDLHTHMTYYWSEESGTGPLAQPRRRPGVTVFLSERNASRILQTGVTTVRDLGASQETDFALRDLITMNAIRGPRMFVSGQGISAGRGGRPGVETMRAAARDRIAAGADWVKVYASRGSFDSVDTTQTLTFDEMKAIVDTAHAAGRKVAIHSYGASGVKDAVRAGADSIEHGIEIDDDTFAEMVRRGTVWVPTIYHNRYYAESRHEYGFKPDAIQPLLDYVGKSVEATRRAAKAGVRIGMGSDAVFSMFGQNTRELEWLVKAGLTPAEALAAATTTAAELLDQKNRLGRIAPGFTADIVGIEGRPLEDIGAVIRGVRWLMKDGEMVFAQTMSPR
jgi:imidazolonepropionase-like amidohydrolase